MCRGNFGSELSRGRKEGEEERVRAKTYVTSAKLRVIFYSLHPPLHFMSYGIHVTSLSTSLLIPSP